MTRATKPKAPPGLSPAGKALWTRLVEVFTFESHELAVLEVACHQADDVAALEAIIARDGLTVAGSNGQPRLNMAVAEVRQSRLALAKLLGGLALPDELDKPMTELQRRAKHAADARWGKTQSIREANGTA